METEEAGSAGDQHPTTARTTGRVHRPTPRPRGDRLAEHGLVHALGFARHPAPREALHRPVPPGVSQLLALHGLCEQPMQGAAQGVGVPGAARAPRSPPSTTESGVPDGTGDTGLPHAIASSGTIPNGSYHGEQTTTSVRAQQAPASGRGESGRASQAIPYAQFAGEVQQPRSLCVLVHDPATGPPAITSSAPGSATSAYGDIESLALHQSSHRDDAEPVAPWGPGPVRRNSSVSTPHGTTVMCERGMPIGRVRTPRRSTSPRRRRHSGRSCTPTGSAPAGSCPPRPGSASSRCPARGTCARVVSRTPDSRVGR